MSSSWPILALVLGSVYKPILLMLVVSGWARVAGWLDKDLEHYFLARRTWNAVQLGTAALAVGLWLWIPYFWVGLLLALVLLIAAFFAYAVYRNSVVPPAARWTFSLDSLRYQIEQVQVAQATKRATVTLLAKDGSHLEMPAPSSDHGAAHEVLQDLMDFTLRRGGDRIELAADAQHCAMVVHVDGVKIPQNQTAGRLGIVLMDYLKENAGLDVADRRRRQTGQLMIDTGDFGRHALDLAFAGSTRGLTMAVYIDRQARILLGFDQLGLLDSQKEKLRPVLASTHGTVIVASPVHVGLTTTIYSLVNTHDPYTQSIITLEDQVAFELEGVNHEAIPSGTDPEVVSERLAVLLRGDPQVVMLSRLAGIHMARQVAHGSGDVRFYVGMRCPDTFTSLKVWLKAVGDLDQGSRAVTAIINQRLVRKLCPVCRVAYKPDPEALRKLNLPPKRVNQLFKHTGKVMVRDKAVTCSNCHGIGYRGRVAVFEVMVLDDDGRHLIAEGQLDQFRAHLRRKKMYWLQEAALLKAVEGVTSVSEITHSLDQSTRSSVAGAR